MRSRCCVRRRDPALRSVSPAGGSSHVAAVAAPRHATRATTTPTRSSTSGSWRGSSTSCRAIPLHLFEANIFYPAHDALAFSEPLIVPALIGAPLAWAGASPVLVYNLVVDRRIRADRVCDLPAGRDLDRQLPRRAARRIAVRLQHAHADPLRARPGHSYLWAAAGAAGDRSPGARRVLARGAAAGWRGWSRWPTPPATWSCSPR